MRTIILALAATLFAQCAPRSVAQPPMTTVYVVRHAEKLEPANPDSPLSPEGEARAQELAKTLGKAGVQHIHVTSKWRTQQTAAPLAKQLDLELLIMEPGAVTELVAHIRAEDQGRVVLVVGHSNTVPDIVMALSGTDVGGIPEERFDRLFKVVIAPDGKSTVEELRYGAPTP